MRRGVHNSPRLSVSATCDARYRGSPAMSFCTWYSVLPAVT